MKAKPKTKTKKAGKKKVISETPVTKKAAKKEVVFKAPVKKPVVVKQIKPKCSLKRTLGGWAVTCHIAHQGFTLSDSENKPNAQWTKLNLESALDNLIDSCRNVIRTPIKPKFRHRANVDDTFSPTFHIAHQGFVLADVESKDMAKWYQKQLSAAFQNLINSYKIVKQTT